MRKTNAAEITRGTPLWRQPRVILLIVIVIYAVLGLAAYWPIMPWDSQHLPVCACGDSVLTVWFLRWTPFALAHGHNPLFTTWLNYPQGANLAQNTLMPLLSLILAPVSVLLSPVASYNFLAWLALPLSALSMFYVARYFTKSTLAGFVAGLLYGFSPYIAGQAANHIMLSFIPLPPLMLLTVWKLFVEQRHRAWHLGLLLAIECIAQFFIEPEILAITAMVIALGALVVALAHTSLITRERLLYASKGLLVTLIITGACLAYPVWFMLLGPGHFTGPNFPGVNPYRSDLIGLIAPTGNERFIPHVFEHIATATAGGDYQEAGDFIGLPLLVGLVVAAIRWRRNRWLLACLGLALAFWVLSLGPSLVVNGHTTSIPLPFVAFLHLPLLENILPSRLSLAEWFFVALAAALSVTEWQRSRTKSSVSSSASLWLRRGGLGLLIITAVIALLPRWPYTAQPTNLPSVLINNPSIPRGAVALTYPFPLFPDNKAMLWQATDSMQFKLLGSYVQDRGPQGGESKFPALLPPTSVQPWLASEEGITSAPWPYGQPISPDAVRLYLQQNGVTTVIVYKAEVNASRVLQVFTQAIGQPTSSSGGVYLWSPVQDRLRPTTL